MDGQREVRSEELLEPSEAASDRTVHAPLPSCLAGIGTVVAAGEASVAGIEAAAAPMHLASARTAIGLLTILLMYVPLYPGLVHEWATFPNLSHGFAVPFLAGPAGLGYFERLLASRLR